MNGFENCKERFTVRWKVKKKKISDKEYKYVLSTGYIRNKNNERLSRVVLKMWCVIIVTWCVWKI